MNLHFCWHRLRHTYRSGGRGAPCTHAREDNVDRRQMSRVVLVIPGTMKSASVVRGDLPSFRDRGSQIQREPPKSGNLNKVKVAADARIVGIGAVVQSKCIGATASNRSAAYTSHASKHPVHSGDRFEWSAFGCPHT